MSKYLLIEGQFEDFYVNGSNMGIHYQKPHLDYRRRAWYKPWTWFEDPDIILPEPSQIVFEVDDNLNIKFVGINDAGSGLAGKRVNLLVSEKELHKLRGK